MRFERIKNDLLGSLIYIHFRVNVFNSLGSFSNFKAKEPEIVVSIFSGFESHFMIIN